MNSEIEAWRERVLAFDRDMEDIRGEEQGHGHGRLVFASEPVDPYRTDDPALNAFYEFVGEGTEVPGAARTVSGYGAGRAGMT